MNETQQWERIPLEDVQLSFEELLSKSHAKTYKLLLSKGDSVEIAVIYESSIEH